MAIRTQSFRKKSLGHPHSRKHSSGDNSQEQNMPTSDLRNLDLHLMNRNLSVDLSNRVNLEDQYFSSESYDENRVKSYQETVNSVFPLHKQESATYPVQYGYNLSIGCPPFNHGNPYFQGLAADYRAAPAMTGMTTPRIPLPVTDDVPVFVNAKQYHGILRRRQCRARLEALNKVAKARKPYLHESRHLHAVKRQRGSGGRFLSTKKTEAPTQSSTFESRHGSLSLDIGCPSRGTASDSEDIMHSGEQRTVNYSDDLKSRRGFFASGKFLYV